MAVDAAIAACGVPLETLWSEWEAQVKVQTKLLPHM